jgi:hypothetical protein
MGLFGNKSKDPSLEMHLSSLVTMLKALEEGQTEFLRATLVASINAIQSKYAGKLERYVAFDSRGHLIDIPSDVMEQIVKDSLEATRNG